KATSDSFGGSSFDAMPESFGGSANKATSVSFDGSTDEVTSEFFDGSPDKATSTSFGGSSVDMPESFDGSAEDVTLVSFGPVGLLAALAVLGDPEASLANAGAEPVCGRCANSRQPDRSSTSCAAEGFTPPRIKASILEPLLRSRWSIQLISA